MSSAPISKQKALALVNRYCRTMDVVLSDSEKERLVRYIRLQVRNMINNQTTLLSEDAEVMKQLGKLIDDG